MPDSMKAGQKKYLTFINKQKKSGKSHAEAVALWKEKKGTSAKPKGTGVSKTSKPKPKPKTKKERGFGRPKTLWQKLNKTYARSRVNIETITRDI